MTYKFLLTIFLTTLGSFGALIPMAVAQDRPKCYLINNSGQLTDLTNICNVSQKRSAQTVPTTNDGLNINDNNIVIDSEIIDTGLSTDDSAYILGKNNLTTESGLIDSSYYIDNEIGVNYAAYVRRYQTPSTSLVRQTLREQVFQLNTNSGNLTNFDNITSILRNGRGRIPFLIYRY